MNYFKESLLTYNTDHEISTLLHIHVETNRPKVLIPPSKAKNYVDEIFNEYSVKMYTCPELNAVNSKLAFNLYQLKKTNTNIFQIEQVKRKPLKKKISKKSIPTIVVPQAQQYKSCPCCGFKVINKHKCDHTYCQKSCTRIKRSKPLTLSPQHSPSPQIKPRKKKMMEEEEDFSSQKDQLENQYSKYSNSDHQSDYQSEDQMTPDEQISEQFPSNISNGERIEKKKSKSKKPSQSFNSKKNQKPKNPKLISKISSVELEENKNKNQESIKVSQQQIKQQNAEQSQLNKKNSQSNVYEYVMNKKPKFVRKKSSKKKVPQDSSNAESQFQPNSSFKKDTKKKKLQIGKINTGNDQKQSEGVSEKTHKLKKSKSIRNYCRLEQLLVNTRFNMKIIAESDEQIEKQVNKQAIKQIANEMNVVLKQMPSQIVSQKESLNKQFSLNKQYSEAKIDSKDSQNMNFQNTNLLICVSNERIIKQKSYQEPFVDARLDPVSDVDEQDEKLFKSQDSDKNL